MTSPTPIRIELGEYPLPVSLWATHRPPPNPLMAALRLVVDRLVTERAQFYCDVAFLQKTIVNQLTLAEQMRAICCGQEIEVTDEMRSLLVSTSKQCGCAADICTALGLPRLAYFELSKLFGVVLSSVETKERVPPNKIVEAIKSGMTRWQILRTFNLDRKTVLKVESDMRKQGHNFTGCLCGRMWGHAGRCRNRLDQKPKPLTILPPAKAA